MINIRKDLITKELADDKLQYKHCKLSNRFLSHIFNKYYCLEMCENFYDSEPELDNKLDEMHFDFMFNKSESSYKHQDLLDAYIKVKQIYRDYENKRIEFCSWQEPYFDGNWGMSQMEVDNTAKNTLKHIKRKSISKKDRLYFAKDEEQIRIYCYSRDYSYRDYWFIFKKKTNKKNIKH